MKNEYRIDTENKIITETWGKKASLDDYLLLKKAELSDPLYNPNFDVINDLREVDIKYNEDALNQIIKFFLDNIDKIGKRKSALITKNPNQVAGTMMFKIKSKSLPINVKVFSTPEAALNWILGDRNN